MCGRVALQGPPTSIASPPAWAPGEDAHHGHRPGGRRRRGRGTTAATTSARSPTKPTAVTTRPEGSLAGEPIGHHREPEGLQAGLVAAPVGGPRACTRRPRRRRAHVVRARPRRRSRRALWVPCVATSRRRGQRPATRSSGAGTEIGVSQRPGRGRAGGGTAPAALGLMSVSPIAAASRCRPRRAAEESRGWARGSTGRSPSPATHFAAQAVEPHGGSPTRYAAVAAPAVSRRGRLTRRAWPSRRACADHAPPRRPRRRDVRMAAPRWPRRGRRTASAGSASRTVSGGPEGVRVTGRGSDMRQMLPVVRLSSGVLGLTLPDSFSPDDVRTTALVVASSPWSWCCWICCASCRSS